jgi:hypothetical protein
MRQSKCERIKYAGVYMIVEEVAHASLWVGEAILTLFLSHSLQERCDLVCRDLPKVL